jgi:hypothetical protein
VISPAAAHRRVDHVETILFDDSVPLMPQLIPGAFAGLAMFGLAVRLLRSDTEPGDLQVTEGVAAQHHHRDGPGIVVSDPAPPNRQRRGRSVAGHCRRRPFAALRGRDLPPVLQAGLADFLARYGHRAVAENDVGLPRWS